MKNLIKGWLLHNMFEISTWIGLIFFIRQLLFPYSFGLCVLVLCLVLILVPDTKIRQWMLPRAEALKKLLEKW